MKKKWIVTSVIAIIVLLIGWNVWKAQQTTTVDVETTTIENLAMKETIMTPGVLEMKDEQFIYKEVEKGDVDDLSVKVGDMVKEGDHILTYENKQLELEKKQNQLQINGIYLELSQLKKDHQEIDKQVKEFPDEEALKTQHDQIKLQQQQKNIELEQTLLQKEALEKQLEDLVVNAKVDGIILAVNEAEQQLAEKPFIHIGTIDQMKVTGTVSEYDSLNIKADQLVKITSDVVPEKEWQGKVDFISDLPENSAEGMAQADNGVNYPIEVLPDGKMDLKPGFKMLLEIIINEKTVPVLPINAVVQEGDANYVYIVENGLANQVEVKTGMTNTEKIEITKGLAKEDVVIIDPSETLTDGTEVVVQ